jgi:hypothetical protein
MELRGAQGRAIWDAAMVGLGEGRAGRRPRPSANSNCVLVGPGQQECWRALIL